MKIIFRFYCITLSIIAFVTACQKEPILALVDNYDIVQFEPDGGRVLIAFTTNRNWLSSCSDDWFSVDPSEGSAKTGQIEVYISCEPNGTFGERNGSIEFRADDRVVNVDVFQLANDGIEAATQSYSLTSASQTIEVELISNVPYVVEISDDWIKQIESKTPKKERLYFNVEENTFYNSRKASIILKSSQNGVDDQFISILQAQKDALILNSTDYEISVGGGIIEVMVEANVDFDVNSTSSWIHHIETKSLGSSTVYLKVDANASGAREGIVWITQRDGAIGSILTITQAEAPPFYEMFSCIGQPCKMYNTPDDWEFLMMLFCNDLEGADAIIIDSGYNWFSVCGNYSSRNNTERNPAIRYRAPYDMINAVNYYLSQYPDDVDATEVVNHIAQSRVLRAYSYMLLAPQFQFAPLTHSIEGIGADLPCVPLIIPEKDGFDSTNNPRATVKEVYDYILDDLNFAAEALKCSSRASKLYIDANVAYGLRARVHLLLGNWDQAYADAVAAADGYTPASIDEVSKPAFYDISEHNWIWGYDMASGYPNYIANNVRSNGLYATTSSWLRSFSNNGYATACQCYTCINKLLWDKIPATDVRKGWWVDENLRSPLIRGLTWPGFNDVAYANDGYDKLPYLPYTNVKFGCNPIATKMNEEDMPLMRVEEMILIQAEAKAHTNAGEATQILENFVKTYRDPSYSAAAGGRTLLDEIWFQRRVELWGEGFGVFDNLRLDKPIVRSHGAASSNIADAFRFNIDSQDPWLRMRFPQGEMNTNRALVDNLGGARPTIDMNPSLRDGVTD